MEPLEVELNNHESSFADESDVLSASSSTTDSSSDEITVSIMFCWGNTANGELGLGGIEEEHILAPRELKFAQANSVRTISCGKTHTLVVTNSGHVYSCGSNDYGQLGHDKTRTKLQLVEGLEEAKIRQVACGEAHSMALSVWGELYTWGCDSNGQLGHKGIRENLSKPKKVKSLALYHIVTIASGYKHCLALTNRGELYSWGCNENGQLGIGLRSKMVNEPTLVASLHGLPLARISCGASHSFAVSKSGAVYGWGKNMFGQLGLNNDVDYVYPSQLKTLRSIRVKFIACGEDFSVFLTQDGGVLTCGAGQYGQLGHGSLSNEILPRTVLELMGSTVTQVCCGRRHTLAYVPSRCRVFAFGLGGAGQLGTKFQKNSNSPQLVQGPWIDNVKKFQVNTLYAGGDHCFVTVQPVTNGQQVQSADFRVVPKESWILSITLDKMAECEKTPENGRVDQDLLKYLENSISSPYCINGSFLLPNDLHYCCTSKHPGVDLTAAADCFRAISRVQNDTIKDVIREGIAQLLSNLPSSPPDVESLRLYLSLPLYHEFDNHRRSSRIQGPFAHSYLNLKPEAAKIVGIWYCMQSEEYFERLVMIYKNIVTQLLRAAMPINMQMFDLNSFESPMISSLELLAQLSRLSKGNSSQPKVKFEAFHVSELVDIIDIRLDYVRWVSEKSGKKFFCDYPFLFDASCKMLLLQTDQTLQMQFAVNEATQRAVAMLLFSANPLTVQPLLELTVSRDNLIQDTIRELGNYTEKDFKKPLKVTFIGEEAEDAGGVKKEFFLLLLREVLDPKYGMFKSDPESNSIWFSEDSFEDEIMYYLVGLLCGLAIYNFIIINLPFPVALYKKLLREPVGVDDLLDLSPSLGKGLKDLLNYDVDDVEDVFCLKFEISRDSYGQIVTHELKPGGSNIPVTKENKKEYVELYVDYVLNKSVDRHYVAFHDAFHKVCGGRVLQLFHAEELMAVVIGNENYDWITLENNCEYKNGYSSSDPTIRLFWSVFHELSLEDKKKFLLFLTGTDRIPIMGMKAIKIYIQPTNDDKFLPVAHTCFNLLDLPRYKTKERLRYKLLQAIQQNQGFSLV